MLKYLLQFNSPRLLSWLQRCASGCLVECQICNWEVAGLNFESRPGLLRTKGYVAFHPSGVGKWVPAVAGKAKAGIAHSDCGWTCECAGKTVRSVENMCRTRAPLRWCFTKRPYIKCTYLYLYLTVCIFDSGWELWVVTTWSGQSLWTNWPLRVIPTGQRVNSTLKSVTIYHCWWMSVATYVYLCFCCWCK